MSQAALLERLAALCGVQRSFTDIWGRERAVSRESLRALLGAMGLAVEDEAALRAEVELRETGRGRRLLPPVHVARASRGRARLPLHVPLARIGEPLSWTLHEETGARREGRFVPETTRRRHVGDYAGAELVLAPLPPAGYHRLELRRPGESDVAAATRLIVVPDACHTPEGLGQGGRVWGPAVQLYALRSERNWGIGDFADLGTLVDTSAELGAGVVGVNPLHALFPGNPAHASPYGPSSRRFLNFLYLDPETIPDFAESEEARRRVGPSELRARLVALREADQVDYPRVAELKRAVLEPLYAHFRRQHLAHDTPRARAFREFQRAAGPVLRAYGTFEALAEHQRREEPTRWGWPAWPAEFRSPGSAAVETFAREHEERIEFFEYLQWQAERQLEAAGQRCLEHELKVGLYGDLAIGVDRAGFDVWLDQDLYAIDARIGAPPDDFNLEGQDWGLPPLIPERLVERGYEPLVTCLRANMRHAGALRIDHVMGLMRLFWIPPGGGAADGAYVHYPFDDLLGILALESQRERCLVIGEDLGTVPDAVRQALRPVDVLSYRLLFFMKDAAGEFAPPEDYPEQALVAVTTHDLPTLAGYWQGRDIALRAELGLFPDEKAREAQLASRAEDRTRLLFALEREGLLPEGIDIDLASFPEMTSELVAAVYRYLARSPAKVLTVQLEDVLGQLEQVNLPGTTEQYPSWRRKLDVDVERLAGDPRLLELAAGLRLERGEGRVLAARPASAAPRMPTATYRLQLHRGFGFADATRIVPYLRRLGVSHAYFSPYLEARPGSLHGYDIIDHRSLNPDVGSGEDFERLVGALHEHGMGQILDLVPNHMGVGSDNAWWMDVLEHGRASPYAEFFDIEWRPVHRALRGKVLLPVLEDHYGHVLERGLIQLAFDDERGAFELRYHEHRFPVDPRTYPHVLGLDVERLAAGLRGDSARLGELQSLIEAFGNLPGRDETDAERVRARLRDAEVHKRQLARLCRESPEIARFVSDRVSLLNGLAEEPASHDALDLLLESQGFRLAYWRVAADEINYRRFFDINELAGLRMEHEPTFRETHRFVLELVREGRLDGLRIDHPDGLFDPAGYYARLRRELQPDAQGRGDAVARHCLVAEKILAPHERLPEDWPIDGTTGYDFCNQVAGVLLEREGERALDRCYTRFAGRKTDFDELLYECKKLILAAALSSELSVLGNLLDRISETDRRTRDFTLERLKDALAEVIACFPVYRTYIVPGLASEADRRYVEWAVTRARRRERTADTGIYDFIRDVLLLEIVAGKPDEYRRSVARFVGKFQQLTGPVMAKGLEDTSFYRYHRLLALNEVGGDPRRFGLSVAAFHRLNRERAERWPRSMLNTATHDSKRSEDVRARIGVLSELSERWQQEVTRWSVLNRSRKRRVEGRLAPSKNDEYALYQTLLGAWPLASLDQAGRDRFRERIEQATLKAVREAKVHSSWINPDADYEEAVTGFVRAILEAGEDDPFFARFEPFQRQVARLGMFTSLSQLLLKLTCPGVPDVYQGNEIWTLSLVDPDNRRTVDFAHRADLLERLARFVDVPDDELAGRAAALVRDLADGRIKLYVTWRALTLRRELAQLFDAGEYVPLRSGGPRARQLIAFARRGVGRELLVVAPRHFAALCGPDAARDPLGPAVWSETWLDAPDGLRAATYRDAFTGARVRPGGPTARLSVAGLLETFPVALLVGD